MILDAQLQFSDEQAVTTTAPSSNSIDCSLAGRDIGTGNDLYIVVALTEAMTDNGSDSTVTVSLEGDSTSTFSPDATVDLFTFSALSPAGTVKIVKLDPGAAVLQYQYLQLKYTVANGALSTGKFSSYLTSNIDKWKSFANGSNIS